MRREHGELTRLMSGIQQHMAITLGLIGSSRREQTRTNLEQAAFDWMKSYVNAFYSERLSGLAEEIVHRPGVVLKPMSAEPYAHHWNISLYQKKMIVECDRLIAPVDLTSKFDLGLFWDLVNTPGMYDLIVRGLVYPMPNQFCVPHYTFDLSELPASEFSLSDKQIQAVYSPGPLAGIFVPLPHVENLELDELLDLRDEFEEDWLRYQRACRKFLEQSTAASSEKKLCELALEIDHAVRQLNASYNQNRFISQRRGVSLAIGLAGFVFSLITPIPEVKDAIASAFGSFSAVEGIRFFTSRKEIENQLRADSDFYFPWKVSQLDQAAARKKGE